MKTIAKTFSVLFHPLLLPSIGILILYNSGSVLEYLPHQAKRVIFLIVSISTFILPLTFVPFFIFQKTIMSVQMGTNRERLIPLFVTSILYFLCYYLLVRIGAPPTILKFILAATTSVVVLFLLSFKWKISAHMIGLGGLTGALIATSFRLGVNLEYFIVISIIISGIIGFARLKLKAHEQYQIYAGWLTGIFTSLIVMLFF